jgi:hypothetical protein
VGAPKCGTTSLHYWLSQHPEIFMSKLKEPAFFCTDTIQEADDYNGFYTPEFKYRNETTYLSLFQNVKNEKIRGESSSRYFFSKAAPEKIYNLQTKAKIIIMLRNPVNFMHSFHSEKIKGGTENIENFEEALKAEKDRKKYQKMPYKVVSASELLYSELAHFSKYIKQYQKYFSPEQIKIVILEEIKNNPEKQYQSILEFLQVKNTKFTPEFKVYNRNAKLRSKHLNNFIKNSHYVKALARTILPNIIREKITSSLEKWNKKTVTRKPLTQETKKKLMIKFKPEVEKLSEITNKNLVKLWGYDQLDKL